MGNETCRKVGHDYGNGPGVAKKLNEGDRQTCAACGATRKMENGRLVYGGKVSVTAGGKRNG